MKVYISGPMIGIPHYNHDAFYFAERQLQACDHTTLNPARMDMKAGLEDFSDDHDWRLPLPGFDYKLRARRNLEAVQQCDAIYMLVGWEESVEACAELAVARWLRLHVAYAITVPNALVH